MRKEDLRRLKSAHLMLSEAYARALEGYDDEPKPKPKRGSTLIETTRTPKESKPTPIPVESEDSGELTRTDRKILVALAQLRKPSSIVTVGVVGSFAHTTGPVGTSLGKLRRLAYIAGTKNDLQITSSGYAALGDFVRMPEGHQLFEFWRNKLPKPCGKILHALKVGGILSIEEIGAAEGFAHGTGPVGTALGLLRRMGFVEGKNAALNITEEFRRAIEPTVRVFDRQSGETTLVNVRGHAKR